MVFVPHLTPYFLFNLNLILIGPNLLFSLSSRTKFSSSSVTFRFLILCGFLDWFFNPSMPYVSYRLFQLNTLLSRLQTRCKHPIYSYPNVQARLSFCTYFLLYPLVITLQDWSVNHVRKLKCQPCMEASTPFIWNFIGGGTRFAKTRIFA